MLHEIPKPTLRRVILPALHMRAAYWLAMEESLRLEIRVAAAQRATQAKEVAL